jgi:two-component system, NtrC family, response regulator AtoC
VITDTVESERIVVVSSDSAVLRSIWSLGESNSWQLEITANAWEAMDKVQSGVRLGLVLLDLPYANADGLHIVRWLRRLRPGLPIAMIGHPGDDGRKQEAIRMGVSDYLIRPLNDRQLEMAIQRILSESREVAEIDIASDDIESLSDDTCFIGISPIMRKLRAQAALLAEADVPVLILGEGGAGRETTARLVHRLSARSKFEFETVNCAAFPEDLLEKELFGYERPGTASPAQIKYGKLELCDKGTIFLREITEMPLSLQSKLLQVLRNRRFIRPGTATFTGVDVRVVAASHRNIERAISENRLREDLYHFLSSYTVYVPPLRERKEELPVLSRHFMQRLAKHYGLTPRDLSPATMGAWQAYSWPGNLRELEDSVKRYLMVGDEELAFERNPTDSQGTVRIATFTSPRGLNQLPPSQSHSDADLSDSKTLRSLVQRVKSDAERNAIAAALQKTGWNRKAAARLLKVSYRAVLYKIVQYQITPSNPALFSEGNGRRREDLAIRDEGRTQSRTLESKALRQPRQESL